MVKWIQRNQLGFIFLASLVLGLVLISAAAFTVSPGLGLLASGVALIAGGHWVTYLRTATGGSR